MSRDLQHNRKLNAVLFQYISLNNNACKELSSETVDTYMLQQDPDDGCVTSVVAVVGCTSHCLHNH